MGVEVGGRNVWRGRPVSGVVAALVVSVVALVAAHPAAGGATPITAAQAEAAATPSGGPTTGPGTDEVIDALNFPSTSGAATTVASSVDWFGEGGTVVAGDLRAAMTVGGQALTPTGSSDVWVAASHGSGDTAWVHQFGGAGAQHGVSVATVAHGVLAAFTTDAAITIDGTVVTPLGESAVVVVWIDDASGEVSWVRAIDSAGEDLAVDVAGAGGYQAVAVATMAPLDFGFDATGAGYSVVTLDDLGTVTGVTDAIDGEAVWSVSTPSIDFVGSELVLGFTAAVASAVPGVTLPWQGWPTGVVVTYDTTGNRVRHDVLQGSAGVVLSDVAIDPMLPGSVYVVGWQAGTLAVGESATAASGFLARFDDDPARRWVQGLANGAPGAVSVGFDYVVVGGSFAGTLSVGGLTYPSAGGGDAVVAAADRVGRWRWVETSGGGGNDTVTDVVGSSHEATAVGSHGATASFGAYSLSGPGGFLVGYEGPWARSLEYEPLVPTRVLDTRTTLGDHPTPVDATGAHVQIAGVEGVPSDASAVVANVTVTGAVAASHLTIWPTGGSMPETSNLNYGAGETVANLVTLPIGVDGHWSLRNNSQWAHVVIDVVGVYRWTADDQFFGVGPFRLLDSRDGTGGHATPWGPSVQRAVQVAGVGGVPADASAVVVNLTATNVTQATHLTVWPDGVPMPLASNLNVAAGQTRPNLAIVRIGGSGKIRIFNNAGSTDVIADVVGYYADRPNPHGKLQPIDPQRIVDSRSGIGGWSTPLAATTRSFDVAGTAGVPSTASAAVMNVTVTGPTAPSHLTLWPAGGAKPLASNLNFVTNQTVPNAVISGLGSGGRVSAANNTGSTQVIVDLFGWFS